MKTAADKAGINPHTSAHWLRHAQFFERDEEGNIITLYIFGGISLAVLMGAKQLGSIKGAQKRLGQ